jgi:outer membrane receptor protein involved in Fe transport
VNYIHKFKQSTSAAAGADPEIKSWTTLDLQGTWSGLRNTKFTLGVRNLTDEEPPIAIAETLPLRVPAAQPARTLLLPQHQLSLQVAAWTPPTPSPSKPPAACC